MTQERIWDIWGAKPKPWTELARSRLVRLIAAFLIALPLSAIGFSIADNPSTPLAARLLIAPGYVAASHLPLFNGHFLDDIARFGMTATAIDTCYYTVLIVAFSQVWRVVNAKVR
jgi:hypothetical protein